MAEAYTEIGKTLRASREAMPMSLEHASQKLHIRARYLAALEDGRLDELPGRTYVKGYLLAYAELLHMDKVELVRQFEKIEIEANRSFYFPEVLSREKEANPKMIWAGLLVALVVFILWATVLQPDSKDIYNTEAWEQQSGKKGAVSVRSRQNEACFKPQDVLYPPCYAEEPQFNLLPLNRRLSSVMDLMK